MKPKTLKICIISTIIILFAICNPANAQFRRGAGGQVSVSVSSSPGASGTWTATASPRFGSEIGYMNISIMGAWSGTVTLQRSWNGVTWGDVETWTSNAEKALIDPERGVRYRLGVKSGEYTSGTMILRLSN